MGPLSWFFEKKKNDPFNEALEHYRRFRDLLDSPDLLLGEVYEVVRLCQLAIQQDRRNGDAYVLLADALLLTASKVAPIDPDACAWLMYAGVAVIDYWHDTGFHARNRERGLEIYRTAQDSLPAQSYDEVRNGRVGFLANALSTEALEMLKR